MMTLTIFKHGVSGRIQGLRQIPKVSSAAIHAKCWISESLRTTRLSARLPWWTLDKTSIQASLLVLVVHRVVRVARCVEVCCLELHKLIFILGISVEHRLYNHGKGTPRRRRKTTEASAEWTFTSTHQTCAQWQRKTSITAAVKKNAKIPNVEKRGGSCEYEERGAIISE